MPTDHLYPPVTNKELLKKIATDQGFESVMDLLEHFAIDGVVPGACTVCAVIQDSCEPDMEEGTCSECDNDAVKSCLILAGVI